MALLDDLTSQPPEYTTEQKQAFTQSAILSRVRTSFLQLKEGYLEGFNLILNNPYGLTPAEVLQGLGKDVEEVHRLGQITVQALNQVKAGTIPDNQTIDVSVLHTALSGTH